ncbi:phosphoribosylglycinamide formyltransferase [Gammaproteobacteria bacterium]|nr:phosphoribosylglycinamide formyltransferase [Gammaproteobacteria bacterium]
MRRRGRGQWRAARHSQRIDTLMRWVVMASGGGSNLQAMIDAQRAGGFAGDIVAVVSDVADAHALERARQAGITAEAVPYRRDRANWERELADTVAAHQPDWIALAGFMRVLSPAFVDRFPQTLNVHPSLLPRYRGLDTHQRVLDAGEVIHGTTVHLVDATLDGGPPILQLTIAIESGDTAQTLFERVQRCEHKAYPAVIRLINHKRLTIERGCPRMDGELLEQPFVFDANTSIDPLTRFQANTL